MAGGWMEEDHNLFYDLPSMQEALEDYSGPNSFLLFKSASGAPE